MLRHQLKQQYQIKGINYFIKYFFKTNKGKILYKNQTFKERPAQKCKKFAQIYYFFIGFYNKNKVNK